MLNKPDTFVLFNGGLINTSLTSVGERLNNFQILIGNEFIMGVTEGADIRSWSECAYITGRQLFQYFISSFKE